MRICFGRKRKTLRSSFCMSYTLKTLEESREGLPCRGTEEAAHQWLRHRPDGFEVSNGQMVSTDQGMLRPVACFIGFVSQLAGQLHDMVCFDRQSAREEKHEGLEEVCRLV